MRGLIGGLLTGGAVSLLGLGIASVVSEQPAGLSPPATPLVQAPVVDPVQAGETTDEEQDQPDGPSTPVGSLEIEAPQAPDLPEGEARVSEPAAPSVRTDEPDAPRADTDPLDVPEVASVEGSLGAPEASTGTDVVADLIDPVFPNPQSVAPLTPVNEADLTVQVDSAQPLLVAETEPEIEPEVGPEIEPVAEVEPAVEATTNEVEVDTIAETDTEVATNTDADSKPVDDFFVVDLGADASPPAAADTPDTPQQDDIALPDDDTTTPDDSVLPDQDAPDTSQQVADAPADAPAGLPDDQTLAAVDEAAQTPPAPRVQLSGENSFLTDRDTGVTVRRPTDDAEVEQVAVPQGNNALADYAADANDTGDASLMSIVLIDDGTMSAAAAALAGLPFSVTIALDPTIPDGVALMESYRADGFEVAVIAKLPEGALPSDVEITFESVFSDFPEAIALLDVGTGGLQNDRAVTEQAMELLAAQGRGFVTVSKGLNTAVRAAQQAGVPEAEVYRDLDSDGQDARVVRRFIDQAAFQARRESGVVLVGRMRPDTISALILWGTVNQDDQVAVVPVSQILLSK